MSFIFNMYYHLKQRKSRYSLNSTTRIRHQQWSGANKRPNLSVYNILSVNILLYALKQPWMVTNIVTTNFWLFASEFRVKPIFKWHTKSLTCTWLESPMLLDSRWYQVLFSATGRAWRPSCCSSHWQLKQAKTKSSAKHVIL